uniref:Methyltransferase like 27 n=1 Tax=Falco tinnunculus TaxID=100819 RepID=A0A8C4XSF5_FALTI
MWLPAAVRERVAAVHGGAALPERLRQYDGWAARYEQDVAALEYRAPHLAAASLSFVFPAPPAGARLLDVACGTGLVARELHRRGFRCLHGVDGSAGMLEQARSTGLYRQLQRCVLGQEPLPVPPEHYDAVMVVGALGEGQVPSAVLPELLRVTKPGEPVSPLSPPASTPRGGRTGSSGPSGCGSSAGRWPCSTARTWPCPCCQAQAGTCNGTPVPGPACWQGSGRGTQQVSQEVMVALLMHDSLCSGVTSCQSPAHWPPGLPGPCPLACPLTPGRVSLPPLIPTFPVGDTQCHPSPLLAGGFLCLTTRSNPSNLQYKAELEAVLEKLERQGAWQKVLAQEVERWERATSEEESTQGTGYISGVVYIYRKCPVPPLEEG